MTKAEEMNMERPDYLNGGFESNRYIIAKTNGKQVDPKAKYFVLRYDQDPHARVALEAYAASIVGDNPSLAADLMLQVFLARGWPFGGFVKVMYTLCDLARTATNVKTREMDRIAELSSK